MGPDNKPSISNLAVILWLIFFFPVGILLILIRLLRHLNYTHLKILDIKMLANFLLVFFVILSFPLAMGFDQYLQEHSKDAWAYIMIWLFFGLPCFLCYYLAYRMNKGLTGRFKQYHSLIYTQRVTYIHEISEYVKKRPAVVINELRRMAYLRQLPDVLIDPSSMHVQVRGAQRMEDHSEWIDDLQGTIEAAFTAVFTEPKAAAPKAAEPQLPKTISCYGCGSKTQLKPGESKECEYCGSLLHYA